MQATTREDAMTDTTYNGWTNRATWLVNLHLTNDQGLYEDVRALLREVYDDAEVPEHVRGITDDHTWSLGRASDALRDHVEELTYIEGCVHNDGPPRLLMSDLIRTALADVDWREIAEGLLEE
ncbi:MAG TPA: hypothetical protein VIG24_07585 [Acidimicrobiia bacterium]